VKSQDSLVMFEGGVLEKGYGIVAKQVMQDTNLHVIAKCLYSYLCTYGNGAFPSRELVMGHLGIGKDSFQKYMKQLKDYGYITSKQKVVNGKFSGNVYTIEQIVKPCTVISDTVKKPQNPKKSCTVSSDTVVSDTVKPDTNNTSSFNITSSNNKTTTELPAEPVVVAPIIKTMESEPAMDLPGNVTAGQCVKLANKWGKVHGADIVHRQIINLKAAMARRSVPNPAGWLNDACEGNYPDVKIDGDSPELAEAKEKFKQNELKLIPVEKSHNEPPTENYSFLKSIADRALGQANVLQP